MKSTNSCHRPAANEQRKRFMAAIIKPMTIPMATGMAMGMAAVSTSAWSAENAEADAGAGSSVETVVIGTNRENVSELSGTAPVKVIDSARLIQTGAPTLLQALQSLVPAANFVQGAGVGTEAWNAKAVSLGGLNPNYTLVLLNGKRLNPSAIVKNQTGYDQGSQAVDLDTIPLSAIKRVEVLGEGASAQYGSDAIAGVVNIVLRDESEGGELGDQAGKYTNGQGFNNDVSGWAGLTLPGDGFANLSYNFTHSVAVSTRFPDTRQYYFAGDPREATVDRDIRASGKPDRKNANFLLNAETGLTDGLRLYGFAGYADKDSGATLIPLRPADDADVRAIFPNGAPTTTEQISRSLFGTIGLKFGERSTGLFDLSLDSGENIARRRAFNADNASLGTASPTEFFIGEFRDSQTNAQLEYTRDIATPYATSPLTLTAGVAYRHETWKESPGDPAGYTNGGVPILDGPNAGKVAPVGYPPGNQPLTAADAGSYGRHVKSAFVDLEQPVTSQATVAVAARSEDYSDFGSTTTAQGSFRFDFTPQFAVRTSVGSGYRAPSLGQTGLSQTTGQAPTGVGIITEGRVIPVSNPLAALLGATPLQPEKSTSYSGGLVWREGSSSATLDVYRRYIHNAIVFSGNLTGPYVTNVLNSAGYTDISIVNYFTNAVDLRTQGLDLTLRHAFSLSGDSDLSLLGAADWHDIQVQTIRNNPFLQAAGLQIINRVARNNIEDAAPRNKVVLTADYTLRGWGASLNVTRYGSMLVSNLTNAINDQVIGAKWITSFDARYRFDRWFQLQAGVQNLFDVKTDTLSLANRTVSYTPYPNSPTDPFGTFIYVKATFSF